MDISLQFRKLREVLSSELKAKSLRIATKFQFDHATALSAIPLLTISVRVSRKMIPSRVLWLGAVLYAIWLSLDRVPIPT